MIFIWSTNDLWGSKLIRWGLDEPSSHFALGFFEDSEHATVIESRIKIGVQICSLENFSDRNRLVHILQASSTTEQDKALYEEVMGELSGRDYDHSAIFYWVLIGMLRKATGYRVTNHNPLNNPQAMYCVEVLQSLYYYLASLGIHQDDYSMTSPHEAYLLLKDTGAFRELL